MPKTRLETAAIPALSYKFSDRSIAGSFPAEARTLPPTTTRWPNRVTELGSFAAAADSETDSTQDHTSWKLDTHPTTPATQELGTKELRTTFLVESLFAPEKLELVYSDVDRAIIGSAVPVASPIQLTADAELRAAYFCERRELGVLNIGAPGAVEVD